MAKFLSFIFLSSFILGSSASFAGDCTYANDPNLAAAKIACSKDTSKAWSCETNTCVSTKETIARREGYNKCAAMPEANSDDLAKKKACMDAFSKSTTEVDNSKVKDTNAWGSATYAMAVTLATINTIAAGQEKKANVAAAKTDVQKEAAKSDSTCASRRFLTYSALASIANEVAQNYWFKNALEKKQKEYREGVINQGASYEAQIKAFEYLRDEQKLIAAAAEKKEIGYTTLAAAYTITAGIAVAEAASSFGMKPCIEKEKTKEETKPESTNDGGEGGKTEETAPAIKASRTLLPSFLKIQDYVASTFNFIFPEVKAGSYNEGNAWGIVAGAVAGGGSLFAKKFFTNSLGIAIVAGVSAGMSTYLAVQADKEKTKAYNNAKKVDEIIAKFKSDLVQFCPEKGGRDNINKPECFCYNADRSKNTARSNSSTCNKYWAWKDHDYSVAASSYTSTLTGASGCIDINGQLDTNCNCKKLVSIKTGSNACLKSNISSIDIGSLSNVGSLSSVSAAFDSAFQGNISASNVGSSSFAKYAANMNRVTDGLIKNNSQLKLNSNPTGDKALMNSFISKIATPQALGAAQNSIIGANNGVSSAQTAALPGVEEAIKKSGLGETLGYIGGAGRGSKKSNDSFSIPSFGNDTQGQGGKVVEGFMDQERAFNHEDIVKDDGVPIWTILSNRYMTSGFRRLFEDKAPEAVTTTQTITQ